MPRSSRFQDLAKRFRKRDRRALARLIRLIEDGQAPDGFTATLPRPKPVPVIGITGSGGVGKSTLVAALIEHFRSRRKSIAVLACDPHSPLSGGCLMGDRIRARFDPSDEGVYFRSFSTRGATGGIAAAVAPTLELLTRFGFDLVLVETVGVGQDEVAVRDVADFVVLVLAPGMGDEVQWQKAGLIEVANLVVVNKADLPGADAAVAQLRDTLAIGHGTSPPVLKVTATTGDGVPNLAERLEAIVHTKRTGDGRP